MIEPTTSKRDQRREVILNVAREVFFEEGFSAASMSMIAARLGGSKGTLYNYFKNKDELFAAHIQHQCELVADGAFGAVLDEEAPVDQVLTRLGERYLHHIYSDWGLQNLRLLITEAKRSPGLAETFYRAGPAVGEGRLTLYLERAKQRGLINPPDCRRAAGQFIALCRGGDHLKFMLNLIDPPSAADIESDVSSAVAMFMAAYEIKPQY